jgi:hypothetical protein
MIRRWYRPAADTAIATAITKTSQIIVSIQQQHHHFVALSTIQSGKNWSRVL